MQVKFDVRTALNGLLQRSVICAQRDRETDRHTKVNNITGLSASVPSIHLADIINLYSAVVPQI